MSIPEAPRGGPERIFTLRHPIAEKRFKKRPSYVENPSNDERKRFPLLFEGEYRIRFHPGYGGLFIKRYRRKRKTQDNIAVADKGVQESFQIDLDTEQSEPQLPQMGHIENTIRAASHIVTNNGKDSERVKGLKTTLELADYLYDSFTTGEITDENLTEYLQTSYDMLDQSGMLRDGAPNRNDAVEQIQKALGKDKLGRFNPLISRTRLASATIKLIYEQLVAEQTVQKYTYLLTALLYGEREAERLYLEQILEQSLGVLNLSPDNRLFSKSKHSLEDNAFQLLAPDVIKVSPYRIPAIWYLISVFGFPKGFVNGLSRADYRYVFEKIFTRESSSEIFRIHKQEDDSPESNQRFLERLQNAVALLQETLEFGEKELEKLPPEERIVTART